MQVVVGVTRISIAIESVNCRMVLNLISESPIVMLKSLFKKKVYSLLTLQISTTGWVCILNIANGKRAAYARRWLVLDTDSGQRGSESISPSEVTTECSFWWLLWWQERKKLDMEWRRNVGRMRAIWVLGCASGGVMDGRVCFGLAPVLGRWIGKVRRMAPLGQHKQTAKQCLKLDNLARVLLQN